jgi:thiosulfate/3-mercaptopyruvate sulfurtransferase
MYLTGCTLTLLLFAPAADKPGTDRYPRADLLVEPAALAKALPDGTLFALDVRPRKQYDAGHVPGALWVDHDAWSKAFAAGQDPKEWTERIEARGIQNGMSIVVYDDNLSKDAARIWWILRYWGLKDVRLLNGGWKGWTTGKYPVRAIADEPLMTRGSCTTAAQAARLATKEQILKDFEAKRFQIIDTRSKEEHCGETKTAKRNGSIPGALHLEWTEALDKKTQRFKEAGELTKLLKDAGIDLGRATVTHCQSGGRAAVMAFTLELMGGKDVRNYYRSWAEWGNAEETPVVQPK